MKLKVPPSVRYKKTFCQIVAQLPIDDIKPGKAR